MPLSRKREPARRGKKRVAKTLLAVDVGNSETVVGRFQGGDLVRFWRLTSGRATADEVRLALRGLLAEDGGDVKGAGAVVCSVAPTLTLQWLKALETLTGKAPVEVT